MPAPKGSSGEVGTTDGVDARIQDEASQLRTRLLVSLALTVPVVALSMIPPLQFTNWQWLALTARISRRRLGRTPLPPRCTDECPTRRGNTGHSDLGGVSAAYLWSLWALFFGHAGMAGMKMEFSLFPQQEGGADHIYLEVAAAVTVFILAGRYFEARAKKQSGAALRALMDMGAKDVAVLREPHRDPNSHRTIGGR